MFSDAGSKGDRSSRPPLECLVCGKLFPRGALDLSRHQTAQTLLHTVSNKKSAACKHGCSDCGHYFSSKEHLVMHTQQSTCGKKRYGFSIPENECIICGKTFVSATKAAKHEASNPKHIYSSSKRLSMQYKCGNCGLYFVSEEIIEQHSQESFCKSYRKSSSSNKDGLVSGEVRSSKKSKRGLSDEAAENPSPPSTAAPSKKPRLVSAESTDVGHAKGKGKSKSKIQATEVSEYGEHNMRRAHRVRSLIPVERKALYAICSLLIDKESLLNTAEAPNEDNMLPHIASDKKNLVERLMGNLSHRC